MASALNSSQLSPRGAGIRRAGGRRRVAIGRGRLSAGDSERLVGTPVQVSLPGDVAVSTIAIPRDALVQRGNQVFVFKVRDDGTAEQVAVQTAAIVGLWVGVARGLAASDQVIVRGVERVSPGQAVEIIESISAR